MVFHLVLVYKCAYNKAMSQTHSSSVKTRITIRIDGDILEWFRGQAAAAGGGNYQSLINHALREYMLNDEQPLDEILRRVIREELSASRSSENTPISFKSNTRLPR